MTHVIYGDPGGVGYHPILYMARLAAELLDAELVTPAVRAPSPWEALSTLLPRARGKDALLLICRSPTDLRLLTQIKRWRQRFAKVVVWVFDSFWVDRIPRYMRFIPLDHVFVTESDDLEVWRQKVRAPVDWAPWGSDVLRLGSGQGDRPIDVLRVGRQPLEWEQDTVTRAACEARGLSFQGRPEASDDANENQLRLMQMFAASRFSLSFSNSVNPAIQTHPYRQYLTARWTDAVSAGAVVAGVLPRSVSVDALLWPEAFLELGSTNLSRGLDMVKEEWARWTTRQPALNYWQSLRRLDWRWRFQRVANALAIRPATLQKELVELEARIASARPSNISDEGSPNRSPSEPENRARILQSATPAD